MEATRAAFVRAARARTPFAQAALAAALAAAASGLAPISRHLAAQDLAIANAVVVDPADETAQRGALLVENGRIRELAPDVPTGFDGAVLDARGGYVIPALADMHVHAFGNAAPAGAPQLLGPLGSASAALYSGVAFILDLFSPEEMILAFRDRQRAGKPQGALLFAAGPCLTATGGHCTEYGIPTRIVDTPEDARREVSDLARSAPDVVKIVYDHQSYGGRPAMPTVDLPTLTAALAAARERGIRSVVHIGTWQDAQDAVAAGADAITHTPGPEPLPAGLAELMARQGTFFIPTLAVQGDMARILDDPGLLDDSLLAATAAPAVLDSYRRAVQLGERMAAWADRQREMAGPNLAAVGAIADAGVAILAGTDAGNVGVFQGYSLHRELELLHLAGLSPWAALRTATTDAARFLGHRWGVEPGDEATLLVLEASPLESISNTKRIRAVIRDGVVVDREALLLR